VERWAAATLQKGPEDVGLDAGDGITGELQHHLRGLDPVKRLKAHKLAEEIGKLRRQNAQFDELYVDKAAAREEIAAVIHNTSSAILAELRSGIEALHSMGLLAKRAKKEAHSVMLHRFEQLLEQFANGMSDAIDRTR